MIAGNCHCGAVRLEVPEAPTTVTECNCSVCRRLGLRMAYYAPAQVKITGAIEPYAWGDRNIAFHRCPTCGCTTHWQSLKGKTDRMGVNARMIDGLDWSAVRVLRFDGADTWTYLD